VSTIPLYIPENARSSFIKMEVSTAKETLAPDEFDKQAFTFTHKGLEISRAWKGASDASTQMPLQAKCFSRACVWLMDTPSFAPTSTKKSGVVAEAAFGSLAAPTRRWGYTFK
jgi:hypothetical protein